MKIVRFVIYIILFFLLMLLFFPKREFVYLLDQKLYQKGIVFEQKNIKESWFGINLYKNSIYYNKLKIANIKDIDAKLYLFKNTIKLNNVNLTTLYDSNKDFKNITLTWSYKNITKLNIKGDGILGKIDGYVDFKQNLVHIVISATDKLKKIGMLSSILKYKNGKYIYESKLY